jgi:hypothetical protein
MSARTTSRSEAGGHAVVRARVLGERVDDRACARDLAEGLGGQDHAGPAARDRDDIADRRRADADGDLRLWVHGAHSTQGASRSSTQPPLVRR